MLKFLIVDDDKEESLLIQTHLENCGYSFDVYNFPKEALVKIQKRENEPNILIVDLNMPEINGIQFVTKMRDAGLDIPVILTCTDPDKELVDKTINMGLDRILHKPIQKDELLAEIKEIQEEYDL
ncbi:MAG: response regulator [Bdellovibrionales bacterium]|nr:response regulator [Bdellovibrionales bacterium]